MLGYVEHWNCAYRYIVVESDQWRYRRSGRYHGYHVKLGQGLEKGGVVYTMERFFVRRDSILSFVERIEITRSNDSVYILQFELSY